MSEIGGNENGAGGTGGGQPQAGGDGGDSKTFTQEQLNTLLADQKRKLQSSYSDYTDLKSKAQQFDQLSEAQKTEAQRQADALKATESRASAAEAELARAKAALKYKLADEDLDLLGSGSPEEIDARAKRLSERLAPKAPNFDGGSRKSAGTPQNMNDVIRRAAGLG